LKLFLLVLCAALTASAQAPGGSTSVDGKKDPADGPVSSEGNPVQQLRDARSWEMGPFVDWATGLSERSDFKFFSLGFQLGKPITRVLHAGILSGQFELAGNIMPLWQAYTPAPHEQTFVYQGVTYTEPIGGGTYTGVSITPVILRWNFLTRSKHIQPWFQGAGGLVYTTHKFPPDVLVPHPGRNRHALVHRQQAIGRPRRERGPHFVGFAGRPQSWSERQPAGAGRLYMVEVNQ
jgi:hypothetical protein